MAHYRTIDWNIGKTLAVIAASPNAVFLDSADSQSRHSRFSFLGFFSEWVVQSGGGNTIFKAGGRSNPLNQNLFEALADLVPPQSQTERFPFEGGLMGYLGYEACRSLPDFQHLAKKSPIPDMLFAYYSSVLVTDHVNQEYVLVSAKKEDSDRDYGRLKNLLKKGVAIGQAQLKSLQSETAKANYLKLVETVQSHIREGDCYQVNLSRRLSGAYQGQLLALYSQLRTQSPAPFGAYLRFGKTQVLSASPERFFKIENSTLESRPIKGTAARDLQNPANDQALADALRASTKDRAELVMIVDLLRNDIGKIAKTGTVKVTEIPELESYAQVHHLVATITAELPEKTSPITVLKSLFPGGSITGAPKKAAMEIIHRLEKSPRGVYTGCIGYIGSNGCDFNVAIRTLYGDGKNFFFHAGGGITAASEPEAEWDETVVKASGILGVVD